MKKKILYIHHGKGIGGAPLSLLYMIQGLNKEKYDPHVLFLHDSEAMQLFKNHNIPTYGPVNRFDFSHTRIWWLRWYHAFFFLKIVKDTVITRYFSAPYWLDQLKPDIIHCNTSSLIAWARAAKKRHIPVVWHIRESLADGYLGIRKKIVSSCVRNNANAIIPISYQDGRPWQQEQKTTVVYNAVNHYQFDYNLNKNEFLKAYELTPIRKRILFLGGLSAEKGTELILKIFDQIAQTIPDTDLLIAGYFTIQSNVSLLKKLSPHYQFTQRVKDLYEKNQDRIKLLGPILQVPEALAASDILVFPATVGHFARPIIEAGFMKKPVVASSLPPLDELVISEETGYLIDPYDEKRWLQTLLALLQNKQLREQFGENAYHFCIKNFSIATQVTKIQEIYNKV